MEASLGMDTRPLVLRRPLSPLRLAVRLRSHRQTLPDCPIQRPVSNANAQATIARTSSPASNLRIRIPILGLPICLDPPDPENLQNSPRRFKGYDVTYDITSSQSRELHRITPIDKQSAHVV